MEALSSERSLRTVRTVVALATGLLVQGAYAACDPNAICPNSPCTINNSTITVDNGCVLSWSGKSVTVGPTATIQVASGGAFTVQAASLTVQGLLSAPGGGIVVQTTGQFRTTNSGTTNGRVHANGLFDDGAGFVQITAGSLVIESGSSVRADGLDGLIDVCGGTRNGSGVCDRAGSVSITANPSDGAGTIVVGGDDNTQILIHGSPLTIGANASVRANAADEEGTAGGIDVRSNSAVTISGRIEANKADNDDSGGEIKIVANGNSALVVNSSAVLQAVGGNDTFSSDGSITIGPACTVTFAGLLDSNGGTHSGTNVIEYRNTLNATGGRGEAGAEGSNAIHCRSNGTGACVNAPTGINQQKFNPDAVTTPIALAECSNACGNGVVEGSEQCDDGNFAICDGCENCVITSLSAPCNDGNACTTNDVCSSFQCVGAFRDCDDGNPCTRDSCSSASGCAHTAFQCTYQLALSITEPDAHVFSAEGQPLTSVGADIGVTSTGVSVFNGTTGVRRFTVTDFDVADFGRSISGVSAKLIVGIPNGLGTNPGEARVYNAITGAPLGTIPNPSSGNSYSFGWSVAASGTDDVVVGTPVDDSMGTAITGAAFRNNLSNGMLLTSYFAPVSGFDAVGWSVSALAGRVAVGAPDGQVSNGVLIFPVTGGSPLSIPGPTGDPYDLFGQSVALLGTASGTPNVVVSDGDASEKAYIFDGSSGSLLFTLSPNGFEEGFGYPVAGVAGNAVVAAQGLGQARLFNGFTGAFIQNLTPPGGIGPVVAAARGNDILVGGGGGVNVYKTRCGNNVLESGEQCDDGNTRDDDCCTSQCQLAPLASSCNNGNPCAYAICDINHHCSVLSCIAGVPCGIGGTCGAGCICQP